MQNLKKKWTAVSKMTWRIWWTLTRELKTLKIYSLKDYFRLKNVMFQLKNYRGVMCDDTEGWCEIYRKTDSWRKIDRRNLVNFYVSSRKSENLYFNGLLLSKAYKFSAKNLHKSMSRDTEEWCNLWRKNDFWFEKWHEKFGEFSHKY